MSLKLSNTKLGSIQVVCWTLLINILLNKLFGIYSYVILFKFNMNNLLFLNKNIFILCLFVYI